VSDYYDYTPPILLPKTLAIAGSHKSHYRKVAYDLGALSGLSLKDLQHWISHVSGQSVEELTLTVEGYARYLELEEEMLTRLLSEQPFGIAVLGQDTLTRDSNVELVRQRAILVYLNYLEPIAHSPALHAAEVVVDMQKNSVGEAVRFLYGALPPLAKM